MKKRKCFKRQNNFKKNPQQENYRNKFMSYTDSYYEKQEEPEKEFNLKKMIFLL